MDHSVDTCLLACYTACIDWATNNLTTSSSSTLTHYQRRWTHLSQDWISDCLEVDTAVVRQVIEDISSTHGLRSSLTVAKDEVNPVMKLNGHNLRLQCLTVITTSLALSLSQNTIFTSTSCFINSTTSYSTHHCHIQQLMAFNDNDNDESMRPTLVYHRWHSTLVTPLMTLIHQDLTQHTRDTTNDIDTTRLDAAHSWHHRWQWYSKTWRSTLATPLMAMILRDCINKIHFTYRNHNSCAPTAENNSITSTARHIRDTVWVTTYHTIDADKIFRSFCPRWKHDVSKRLSFVIAAKVVTVAVGEHVRHVEELRNQLLSTAALNTHHSSTAHIINTHSTS